MVSKRDGVVVLYPVYFDADQPRPPRRVPKDLAVHHPTAEQIAKAAVKLNLKPTLETGAAHPSDWWERAGRVLLPARGTKSVLVHQIAEILKKGQH